MIRERHLSETGLRDGWHGGVLAGRTERDIVTAGSQSSSGGEPDGAQQRQGDHENRTNPPGVVERRHRVVAAVCGHGSSSRPREGTCENRLTRGVLDSKRNPALFSTFVDEGRAGGKVPVSVNPARAEAWFPATELAGLLEMWRWAGPQLEIFRFCQLTVAGVPSRSLRNPPAFRCGARSLSRTGDIRPWVRGRNTPIPAGPHDRGRQREWTAVAAGPR